MDDGSLFSRLNYVVNRHLWEAKRGIWLKKKDFYRELSLLEREFKTKDCVLFCYGSVVGVGLHLVLITTIQSFGSMVVFSLLITAIASLITCMCYAELASLAPSTGAVYHYCYYTIGELVAFLVGWNMIFAYIYCCAFSVRYMGVYIDHTIFNDLIRCELANFLLKKPIGFSYYKISNNTVLLSLIFALLLTGLCSVQTKISKEVNNIVVVLTIIFTGLCLLLYSTRVEFDHISDLPKGPGQFDYFMCASAHMAYCLSGNEVAFCMGEEAENPAVTIPRSILFSIKAVSVVYFLMACLHISVWPSTDQDRLSPISNVLIKLGFWPFNWLAIIAAITGMWSSAYASMFLVTRIIYAMSRDGLIPKVFSKVNRTTSTPVVPAFITGIIIGMFGTLLEEKILGEISEIGALFGHLMAAVCLLITRYRCENIHDCTTPDTPRWVLFNYPRQKTVNKTTQAISLLLILNLVLGLTCLILVLRCAMLFEKSPYAMRFIALFLLLIDVLLAVCLYQQPQNDRSELYYTVRGVPTIPIFVIAYDIFSITNVGVAPWIAIIICSLVGLIFYLSYSVAHSSENRMRDASGNLWSIMKKSNGLEW